MKKILLIIAATTCLIMISLQGISQKRPLTGDDILKWNRIGEQKISNDGQFIVYKTEPWKGDPELFVADSRGKELIKIPCGSGSVITEDSKFLVFKISPQEDVIRSLKLKKTKKDDMPGNSMAILNLNTLQMDSFPDLQSFQVPAKWTSLAYQLKAQKKVKEESDKTEESNTEEAEKTDKKKDKVESDKNGRVLYLRNLETGQIQSYPFVINYMFAEEKEVLVFVTTGDDKDFKAGIYQVDISNNQLSIIHQGSGEYKQITLLKDGSGGAFLADDRDEKERKEHASFTLYSWSGNGPAEALANNQTAGIPAGWEISDNGRISISDSGRRIFLGLAPIKPPKDTTILDEEKPVLDVWHWNEPVLQTVQLKNQSRDSRKTYLTVFHIDSKSLVPLETPELSGVVPIKSGDSDQLVAWSNLPYAVQTMWEGSPEHNDIYLMDIFTGQTRLIKKDVRIYPAVSPKGEFIYWYNAIDSTYNSYEIGTGKEYVLTHPDKIQVANELNDIPNPPGSYGEAGWLTDDKALIIYDRYNIWQIDPRNAIEPKNLTSADPGDGISFRIIDFDRAESRRNGIDPSRISYLSGHNEITREDGYFFWDMKKSKAPKPLLYGKYKLGSLQKAKNADIAIFTLEDFQIFPDIRVSDLKFKDVIKVSNANPQSEEFLWGTAELVSWTSLDGRKLEGTLHKPENFDPDKKYPMIVNFYEKSSQDLFSHHIPERGRSTIDYHYYTSHDYLIFNPDVYYKEGYPGEDAFNCVMPGITALIEKGFVDEKAIGAQGHSWGGYQVAYLATRTNLFAAIESGAPVVNMFSAYGGIRWGSGLNRSFQYEHTQSRIGKSIWEAPLRYLENSPLFTLDKVNTPILIMHNDDDGAVPWYQGIEYFIGLRRLGKPAWLLNYNNADHWPTRLEDKHDFQIRLAQFFDHYLKGDPMPEWMEKGIPAVEKGSNLGY